MSLDLSHFDPLAQCLRCRYDLFGLREPVCPECGESFEPSDPRTYHSPLRVARRRFLRAASINAITVAGMYLLLLGVFEFNSLFDLVMMNVIAFWANGPFVLLTLVAWRVRFSRAASAAAVITSIFIVTLSGAFMLEAADHAERELYLVFVYLPLAYWPLTLLVAGICVLLAKRTRLCAAPRA